MRQYFRDGSLLLCIFASASLSANYVVKNYDAFGMALLMFVFFGAIYIASREDKNEDLSLED